jgi:AcrR family transcriptional regulator
MADRKTVSKSEVTARRLFEISMHQFLEKGFDATTMRNLAAAAELSPGAFYYHFPNKEAIIQLFYQQSFDSFREACQKVFTKTEILEERFLGVIEARLKTFDSSRDLLVVLSRSAVDPRSPLSPFGNEQKEIREATIGLMKEMIEGSDLKCEKGLRSYLPDLFWMYMMSMILYWVFDQTKNQKKTADLIHQLTPQICKLVRYTRIPLSGTVMAPLKRTLRSLLGER